MKRPLLVAHRMRAWSYTFLALAFGVAAAALLLHLAEVQRAYQVANQSGALAEGWRPEGTAITTGVQLARFGWSLLLASGLVLLVAAGWQLRREPRGALNLAATILLASVTLLAGPVASMFRAGWEVPGFPPVLPSVLAAGGAIAALLAVTSSAAVLGAALIGTALAFGFLGLVLSGATGVTFGPSGTLGLALGALACAVYGMAFAGALFVESRTIHDIKIPSKLTTHDRVRPRDPLAHDREAALRKLLADLEAQEELPYDPFERPARR